MPEETRRKISEALKGHPVSERSIQVLVERTKGRPSWHKGKEGLKGNKHPMFGKHHSPETRKKMSLAGKGKHKSPKTEFKKGVVPANKGKHYQNPKISGMRNPMYGRKGELHPEWKGGRKMAAKRHYNKRKREYKFIPLNECEHESWEGHHLDEEYVLYVPKELHKSVYHTQNKQETMDKINNIVIQWYIEYYGLQ